VESKCDVAIVGYGPVGQTAATGSAAWDTA
jgi:thioredoxin reductase